MKREVTWVNDFRERYVSKLQNSFPKELKKTKQKTIYTNVTENLFVNEKKSYKFMNITIVECTQNVYHVTLEGEKFFNTGNLVKNAYKLILKQMLRLLRPT